MIRRNSIVITELSMPSASSFGEYTRVSRHVCSPYTAKRTMSARDLNEEKFRKLYNKESPPISVQTTARLPTSVILCRGILRPRYREKSYVETEYDALRTDRKLLKEILESIGEIKQQPLMRLVTPAEPLMGQLNRWHNLVY